MRMALRFCIGLATLIPAISYSYYDEGTRYKSNVYKPMALTAPTGLLDGFYLGITGGYDSYRIRENVNQTAASTGDTINMDPALDATGFMGNVFLGYGYYFYTGFYLGAELYGSYSGATTDMSITTSEPGQSVTFTTTVSPRTGYGMSVLPGVLITDQSLIYLRIAYNRLGIRTDESFSDGSVDSSSYIWTGGWGLGIGLETLITGGFSVRSEFIHTEYNRITSNIGTKFSPIDNQGTIGLVYHFA